MNTNPFTNRQVPAYQQQVFLPDRPNNLTIKNNNLSTAAHKRSGLRRNFYIQPPQTYRPQASFSWGVSPSSKFILANPLENQPHTLGKISSYMLQEPGDNEKDSGEDEEEDEENNSNDKEEEEESGLDEDSEADENEYDGDEEIDENEGEGEDEEESDLDTDEEDENEEDAEEFDDDEDDEDDYDEDYEDDYDLDDDEDDDEYDDND